MNAGATCMEETNNVTMDGCWKCFHAMV